MCVNWSGLTPNVETTGQTFSHARSFCIFGRVSTAEDCVRVRLCVRAHCPFWRARWMFIRSRHRWTSYNEEGLTFQLLTWCLSFDEMSWSGPRLTTRGLGWKETNISALRSWYPPFSKSNGTRNRKETVKGIELVRALALLWNRFSQLWCGGIQTILAKHRKLT